MVWIPFIMIPAKRAPASSNEVLQHALYPDLNVPSAVSLLQVHVHQGSPSRGPRCTFRMCFNASLFYTSRPTTPLPVGASATHQCISVSSYTCEPSGQHLASYPICTIASASSFETIFICRHSVRDFLHRTYDIRFQNPRVWIA
jgi:hypothetical protein